MRFVDKQGKKDEDGRQEEQAHVRAEDFEPEGGQVVVCAGAPAGTGFMPHCTDGIDDRSVNNRCREVT